MKITIISALAANRVIGKNNDLPWKLPSDLQHFKRTTKGQPMLMGRKTWESFGCRPLPGRPHIVLSRNMEVPYEHRDQVFVVSTIQEGLDVAARLSNQLYVIGGATIYEQMLPLADEMILSELTKSFDGDTYFPVFTDDEWKIASEVKPMHFDDHSYVIRTYHRRG